MLETPTVKLKPTTCSIVRGRAGSVKITSVVRNKDTGPYSRVFRFRDLENGSTFVTGDGVLCIKVAKGKILPLSGNERWLTDFEGGALITPCSTLIRTVVKVADTN